MVNGQLSIINDRKGTKIMPRKNCNARPVQKPTESWISLLPYDGRRLIEPSGSERRIKLRTERNRQEAGGSRQETRIKTTGESIVREFRSQNAECGMRNAELNPKPTFQPYRVIPQAQPSPIYKIFNRINWAKIFDIVCMGLAILAIAAVSGVMFFGPISWREFIR
jgi:hypothetical protein